MSSAKCVRPPCSCPKPTAILQQHPLSQHEGVECGAPLSTRAPNGVPLSSWVRTMAPIVEDQRPFLRPPPHLCRASSWICKIFTASIEADDLVDGQFKLQFTKQLN